ncbi:hypothetical protein ACFY1U_19630 [Streptomyces sp. NPDC001351]|uniref:hypothetical protein n=1 Tax=Streptomyces sp. NPDC001351 TaxID=3364564 RepID=UPI0036789A87
MGGARHRPGRGVAARLGLQAVLGRRPVLDQRRDQLPDGTDGPVPAKDPSMVLGVTSGHPAGTARCMG